jgi:hypothetical protein
MYCGSLFHFCTGVTIRISVAKEIALNPQAGKEPEFRAGPQTIQTFSGISTSERVRNCSPRAVHTTES